MRRMIFLSISIMASGLCFAPADCESGESETLQPWSLRMTESVLRRHPVLSHRWDYTSGLMLTGIERVWECHRDPRLLTYIKDNIDRFVEEGGGISTYDLEEFNLDQINEGKALFLLHRLSGEQKYRQALALLREQLRRHPRTSEGGYWHKQIYPCQMWLDGLYMAAPFYAAYIAEFGQTGEFEDVIRQFALVYRHTRDARTGLLYHGWDEKKRQIWADPETGCSPHVWGRAMGWFLMALVDVLDYLPKTHPGRGELLRMLAETAAAVGKVQDEQTGLWYQVLDQGGRAGNYLEASASCMFVYALAKGVRHGYLDRELLAVADKGYRGILRDLIEVERNGAVHLNGVCQVAGLGGPNNRDGSFAYYLSEPVVTDDYKGVGAFILAAVEMEQVGQVSS